MSAKEVRESVFEGPVQVMRYAGHVRSWMVVSCVRFSEVQAFFKATPYNHATGKGWQREQIDSHIRSIYKDIKAGRYTPTPLIAGLLPWHKNHAVFPQGEDDGENYRGYQATDKNPLPLLDGWQRVGAFARLRQDAVNLLKKAETDEEKEAAQAAIQEVDDIEFTILVELEHEHLKTDFLNLQKGRPVDRNQIKSMERSAGLLPPGVQKVANLANDAAELLNKEKDSHLYGQIKFDSRSAAPINYNTITTSGKSELGNSLFGGGLIADKFDKDANWLSTCYVAAYRAILSYCDRHDGEKIPYVMTPDYGLCPAIHGGTKAGTSLIIGVGNCLAWRLAMDKKVKPTDADLKKVAAAIDESLSEASLSGWGAPDKRRHLGNFARTYFADLISNGGLTAYDGIPAELIELLSPSTFLVDRSQLPKKSRGGN